MPEAVKLYDVESLLTTHEASAEFIKNMVALFVQHLPKTSASLEKANNENNWEQVYYFAHKMKAGIDLFNLEPLKEIVRRVEQRALKTSHTNLIADDVMFIKNYIHQCVDVMKKEYNLE